MTPDHPGPYLYFDRCPGAEPQRVEVRLVDGKRLVAHFDGDEPADVLVDDMDGSFQPAPNR